MTKEGNSVYEARLWLTLGPVSAKFLHSTPYNIKITLACIESNFIIQEVSGHTNPYFDKMSQTGADFYVPKPTSSYGSVTINLKEVLSVRHGDSYCKLAKITSYYSSGSYFYTTSSGSDIRLLPNPTLVDATGLLSPTVVVSTDSYYSTITKGYLVLETETIGGISPAKSDYYAITASYCLLKPVNTTSQNINIDMILGSTAMDLNLNQYFSMPTTPIQCQGIEYKMSNYYSSYSAVSFTGLSLSGSTLTINPSSLISSDYFYLHAKSIMS